MKLFTRQFIKDLTWGAIFITLLYGLINNPITHPIPRVQAQNWSIQLMQYPLLFGIAGHNYLALRDENGNVISELHGLATDMATGKWKKVGNDKTDKLKVWEFDDAKDKVTDKNFSGIVLDQGLKENILNMWNKAISCKDPINSEDLAYPTYGINIIGSTENSNSVAYTLSLCMGLNIKHLGLFTPGDGVDLLNTR